MSESGKLLYNSLNDNYDESSKFNDVAQLGDTPYDVTIIGAGVVGCALAYKLSMYKLQILLIDKNYDVGEATSKGNSAIIHTGFDAAVGIRSPYQQKVTGQIPRRIRHQFPLRAYR